MLMLISYLEYVELCCDMSLWKLYIVHILRIVFYCNCIIHFRLFEPLNFRLLLFNFLMVYIFIMKINTSLTRISFAVNL